jgi:hypothetical protein
MRKPSEQAQWTLAGVQNVLFGRYTRRKLNIEKKREKEKDKGKDEGNGGMVI